MARQRARCGSRQRSSLPDVERADAEFALNMAAAINLYLRERLLKEELPDDSDSDGLILFR